MNAVNFEILGIHAGWFDVKFVSNDKQVEISASDAWGNDSPLYFLKMVLRMLSNEIESGYVVFDEEPGTYIVCLETSDDVKLSVLFSNLDDDEWKVIELYGELSRQEIENVITDTEELFVTSGFEIESFARTILRGFEEWKSDLKIREYEENWMEFPEKEVCELRRMLY